MNSTMNSTINSTINSTMETTQNQAAFLRALTGWGIGDIECAQRWLDEAHCDYAQFGREVQERCDAVGDDLFNIDIPATALHFICGQANVDWLDNHIYGNYADSRFDIDGERAGEILAIVPQDERNSAWEWLVDFTGADVPETTEEEE